MTNSTSQHPAPAGRPSLRVGSVSYLNTKPLVYGLDSSPHIQLFLDVPSRLLEGLRQSRFDVALLPIIDYQRMPGLCLLPGACIGCNGPVLTVRIFSQVPIGQITTLACDTDSHTSVALARIILAEQYRLKPEFVDLSDGRTPQSLLLIGDKVVCRPPLNYPYELDLGQAWKTLTGLPFVFAAWVARRGVDLADLPRQLSSAKRSGLAHVSDIVTCFALPLGWPSDLAVEYLTTYLRYDLAAPELQAIGLFHRLAARYGLVPDPPWPLEMHPSFEDSAAVG